MKLARLAAAAAMMTLGTMAALPAAAQSEANRNGATGRTVNWVAFAQGQYQRQPDGSWAELNSQGQITFRFRESGRDDWSVYLSEIGSDKQIQIDVFRMMVTIAQGGRPRSDLYPIIAASTRDRPMTVPVRPSYPRPAAPDYNAQSAFNVEAGPLLSQRDAEMNCPALADRVDGDWTGGWQRRDGRMSVCELRFRGGGRRGNGGGWDRGGGYNVSRDVEVGPIWNQTDAETKCRNRAADTGGEWTGQWRTTVQGRMSVCEIRYR